MPINISVAAGDAIFLPSGRLHAVGAGNLIVEIQQNSDTTYRVFDWDRAKKEGAPRKMHVAEALQCIDFSDREPSLLKAETNCLSAVTSVRSRKMDPAESARGRARAGASPSSFA